MVLQRNRMCIHQNEEIYFKKLTLEVWKLASPKCLKLCPSSSTKAERESLCPATKAVRQENSLFLKGGSAFRSVQVFNCLDEAHSHNGWQSALLSVLVKVWPSSKKLPALWLIESGGTLWPNQFETKLTIILMREAINLEDGKSPKCMF